MTTARKYSIDTSKRDNFQKEIESAKSMMELAQVEKDIYCDGMDHDYILSDLVREKKQLLRNRS